MSENSQRVDKIINNHSVTLTEDDIEEMKQIEWWHSIRLGSIITPGATDVSTQEWKSQAIPEDLTGMTVLDIGAWNGYYSFLAELRGTRRVLAIDVSPARERGFLFAKRVLGSKVEYKFHSVYDLEDLVEKFDLILFLGVYYHLVDPIRALQQIYLVLNDGGTLIIEGRVLWGRKPILRAFTRSERIDPTGYCAATIPWFQEIGEQIGYQGFELISVRMQRDPMSRFPWKRLARSMAWKLGITYGPFRAYRALMRMNRGHKSGRALN